MCPLIVFIKPFSLDIEEIAYIARCNRKNIERHYDASLQACQLWHMYQVIPKGDKPRVTVISMVVATWFTRW